MSEKVFFKPAIYLKSFPVFMHPTPNIRYFIEGEEYVTIAYLTERCQLTPAGMWRLLQRSGLPRKRLRGRYYYSLALANEFFRTLRPYTRPTTQRTAR